MKYRSSEKKEQLIVFGAALLLWFVELLMFADVGKKGLVFCCGLGMIALLFLWNYKNLWNVSSLLLLGYIAFSGFGAIWAMSGKFFLREYTKVFAALAIFLYVMLKPTADRGFVRRVMKVIAAISAWIAFLSVEMSTTGLFATITSNMQGFTGLTMGFRERLYGIYGNSNVEASVYAVGILAALACLAEARNRRDRVISVILCAMSAFSFLLCISVGAIACLALAVVVYLIAAGNERVKVLLRMLFVAVPTIVFAAISAGLFNRSGVLHIVPLLLMLLNAVVAVLLEVCCMEKISQIMERHSKLPFVTMIALVALVAVYLVAALNLTSAYTFSRENERLSRVDYTAAGTHTLAIEADGPVKVWITSQTRYDILQENYPTVYNDVVEQEATFTVPEGTAACNYWFYAEPGTKISSAVIDGTTSIPLKYTILPSFLADRLQGAWTSSSLVIREALWDYGMRLFRLSPVVGNGVGAYESGLKRVEDFNFETKYVHNHYIQVLLESGIIGFVLYVGALLSMAVALIKKRCLVMDEEFGWVYPAVAAIFVMMCTITLWDISMSRTIYLGMIYAVFAVLIRLMATPLPTKKQEEVAVSKKEKAVQANKRQTRDLLVRCGCVVLPALFLVTLAGNMAARSILKSPAASYSEFFAKVKQAAEIDPYEYNDAKLSYVVTAAQEEEGTYIDQANVFAKELLQVQSNSIPYHLTQYYIDTRQYSMAMEAAKKSAMYCAADPDTWNDTFSLLWKGIILNDDALEKDLDTLLPLLLEYRDMLDQRNDSAIQPITLEEPAASAYEMLGEMERLYQEDRQEAADFLRTVLEDYYRVISEMMQDPEEAAE